MMRKRRCVPGATKPFAEVKPPLRAASIPKPVSARIEWAGWPGIPGGAHFIVVDGMNGASAVICDPWIDYGFSEVNTVPKYNPKGAKGTFSGWLLVTT